MGEQGQGFEKPNYTEVPNAFFDMLPSMKESELKVMLFAIRNTFGWHKPSDEISLTQFQTGTGMSRQGVLNGIEQAKKRGILCELANEDGKRGIKLYKVVIKDVDQSTSLTSPQSRPVTSQNGRPEAALTSQPSRHTKESKDSKKEEKKMAAPKKGADTTLPFADLIKAYIDTTKVIDPAIYGKKPIRDTAKAMYEAGITPADVSEHTLERNKEDYWKDKAIPFTEVAKTILKWKEKRAKPAAYGAEPLPTEDYYTPTADELARIEALKADALERINGNAKRQSA